MPYPECSTTCEECDSTCHNYKHCQSKCFMRFHAPRKAEGDSDRLFPLSKADVWCAVAIFFATVLASAAGIGGGAVLVPLYTMVGEVRSPNRDPPCTIGGQVHTACATLPAERCGHASRGGGRDAPRARRVPA
jgi:hypothetical protein